MNNKLLLMAMLGSVCLSAQATDIQDAIKQIKRNNFEKAITIQKKVIGASTVTPQDRLLFDLSEVLLYNNNKYQDYDPLRAYSLYNKVVYSDHITDAKVMNVMREEEISMEDIRQSIEDNLMTNARQQNTVTAYDKIIEACQGCSYLEDAKKERDNLMFNNTLNGSSLSEVNQFLAKYPDSPKREQAIRMRDSIAYAQLPETADAYGKYIATYPNSRFVPELKKKLEKLSYNECKEFQSLNDCAKYLSRYPEGKHASEVQNIINENQNSMIWKVDPTYTDVRCVRDTLNERDYIFVKNGTWGILNSTGASIVSPMFEDLGDVYCGRVAIKMNGRWGIAQVENGNMIYPATLNSKNDIRFVSRIFTAVNNGGAWGLINQNGDEVIPPFVSGQLSSRNIKKLVNNGVAMTDGKNIKTVGPDGVINVDAAYDEVSWRTAADVDSRFIKIRNGQKYGIISPAGKLLYEPMYDMMPFFDSDGVASVKNLFKEGWIDSTGAYIYYDRLSSFKNCLGSEKMIAYEVNGKFGFLDKTQKGNLPLKYTAVGDCFSYGMALVRDGNEWQYIDRTGKVLASTPVGGKATMTMTDGLIFLHDAQGTHLINNRGDKFDVKAYDAIDEHVYSDYMIVTKGGLKGAIDRAAQEVIPVKYQEMTHFCKDYSIVKENGKYGLYYKNKLVLEPIYDRMIDAGHFFEGDCERWEDGESSNVLYISTMTGADNTKFILKDGKVLFSTPFEVRLVKSLDGFTIVQTAEYGVFTNANCALIGPKGEVLVKPTFADIKFLDRTAKDVYFAVKTHDNKWGVINSRGNMVVEPMVENIISFDGTLMVADIQGDKLCFDTKSYCKLPAGYDVEGQVIHNKRTNKYGVIDAKGNIKIYPLYDKVVKVNSNYAVLVKDGKYGILNYR